jgi:hypothetical protein
MWVILSYFPCSPVHVYGTFHTDSEAYEYAERQGMAADSQSAYEVIEVKDIRGE